MFGERYLYAGWGATLSVGAVPRAESPGSAALNKDDLRSYRFLQSYDLQIWSVRPAEASEV